MRRRAKLNNFDHPAVPDVARGERAVIAVPELPREGSRRSADARVEEAEGLAGAIGVGGVAGRGFRGGTVRPSTLLGKGQIDEIAALAKEQAAGLLIVDAALTPVQQKMAAGNSSTTKAALARRMIMHRLCMTYHNLTVRM